MTRSEAGKLGFQKSKAALELLYKIRTNEYSINPTLCKFCKVALDYTHRHDSFCNQSCAAKFNNIKQHKRLRTINPCLNCQQDTNGKFCSLICQAEYRSKGIIADWKNGTLCAHTGKALMLKASIRRYLIQQANNKCSKCGWDKVNPVTKKVPLEVNHIDGDASNCTETNLEVICPNCHSLTSNFRNLNKNGKRNRKPE